MKVRNFFFFPITTHLKRKLKIFKWCKNQHPLKISALFVMTQIQFFFQFSLRGQNFILFIFSLLVW